MQLAPWLFSQTLSWVLASLWPGLQLWTLPSTASVPKLVHPPPGAQISLAVDASDSHMGSILQQLLDGSWAPMAFFSKKLSLAVRKYSLLQGATHCLLYFRHFRFLLY